MIRYQPAGGHRGDMFFRGENPPAGAVIDYYLQAAAPGDDDVDVTILDESGTSINTLRSTKKPGLNRIIWNLRYGRITPDSTGRAPQGGLARPWVLPGRYTVRLTAGGVTQEQPVDVQDDPRIDLPDEVRIAWHRTLMELAAIVETRQDQTRELRRIKERVDSLPPDSLGSYPEFKTELDDLLPLASELQSRLLRLYNQVQNSPGPLTANQRSQLTYFRDWIARLEPRIGAILADSER